MIKEKTCHIALSPAKEEKESQGSRGEEFRLPDGNIIRVRVVSHNHSSQLLTLFFFL